MLSLLLEKDRVLRISVITAAVFYGGVLLSVFISSDFTNIMGQHLGGDFMAFYGAGKAVWQGQAISAYDVAWFEAQLKGIGPAIEYYGLTWQYPPTYFFFVASVAVLPYKVAYLLWVVTGAGFMVVVLRSLPLERYGLILALCSPMLLTAAVQGQNSFFLGGLLILAATLPCRRPLLAGLAAGLLTMKPQLGVLIPLAYIAAGCWRAFFSAALVSVVLGLASITVFGMESWFSFADSLARVNGDLEAGGNLYPFMRMISLYSALGMIGVPHTAAMILHWAFAVVLAGLVLHIWRQEQDQLWRGSVLVVACLFVPPYAYYYEMAALLLTFAALLSQAAVTGWRNGEQLFFILAWPSLLLLPTIQPLIPVQIGFVVLLFTLVLVMRRQSGVFAGAIWPSGRVAKAFQAWQDPKNP